VTNCAPTTEPQFVIIGVAVGGSGFGELGVGFVGARWPMTSPKRPIRPGRIGPSRSREPSQKPRRPQQTGRPPLPTVAPAAAVWSSRATTRRCIRKSLQEGDSEARKHDVKAQLLARLRARRHEAGWAPAASATPGPVSVVSPIATTAPFPCPGEARHLCVLAGWYRCAATGNPLRLRSQW